MVDNFMSEKGRFLRGEVENVKFLCVNIRYFNGVLFFFLKE